MIDMEGMVFVMPKGERRSRKDILSSQIQTRREKISVLNDKISKYQSEIDMLQIQLDEIIQSENKALQEAQEKELLGILKKHNVSKDELLSLLKHG